MRFLRSHIFISFWKKKNILVVKYKYFYIFATDPIEAFPILTLDWPLIVLTDKMWER